MEVLIGKAFESGFQTIVNTVNCVGIMERRPPHGIHAERYPGMFMDYAAR